METDHLQTVKTKSYGIQVKFYVALAKTDLRLYLHSIKWPEATCCVSVQRHLLVWRYDNEILAYNDLSKNNKRGYLLDSGCRAVSTTI